MNAFTAQYSGTICTECGSVIIAGDLVERVTTYPYLATYRHLMCPDDPDDKRPVCPSCFMLKPCECDDQ